jgi:hypothetical protein
LELDYTYSSGGHLIASFYAGQLKYQWLSGPFEGVEESDLTYKSRKIGPEQCVINWHDLDNSTASRVQRDRKKCSFWSKHLATPIDKFHSAALSSIRKGVVPAVWRYGLHWLPDSCYSILTCQGDCRVTPAYL